MSTNYHAPDRITDRTIAATLHAASNVVQAAVTQEIILFNENAEHLSDAARREHIKRTDRLVKLRDQIAWAGAIWPEDPNDL